MILAADNINPMNPAVAGAMDRLDPEPVREIARKCEKTGVKYIDINPGYLTKRREDRMTFLVETVQEATSLNLILDSPDPGILRAGLKACRRTPVLNALTGEDSKLSGILPLASEYGAELVILLLNEKSVCPSGLEGKISLALDLMEKAGSAGLGNDKIIIDPVMPNITWPGAFQQIGECVRAIRILSTGALTGMPVRTMIGLSNLLSGQRHPEKTLIEERTLLLLAGAGLDIALANVLNPELINSFKSLSGIIQTSL